MRFSRKLHKCAYVRVIVEQVRELSLHIYEQYKNVKWFTAVMPQIGSKLSLWKGLVALTFIYVQGGSHKLNLKVQISKISFEVTEPFLIPSSL